MWKLGVVSYLNALPLYQPLLDRGEIEVIRVVPARLADLLDAGTCDAALMPIVDHLRGHGDGLVSDACIGADGFVRSVLLFSKVPLEQVRTVAADASSHTSAALVRVLLRDLNHLEPIFTPVAPDLESMLATADAALLIGDPALAAFYNPGKLHVWDLATAWKQLTGLPFVFAAWTRRKGLTEEQAQELGQLLSAARDEGEQLIPELAQAHASSKQLPPDVVESYLKEAIRFHLTPPYYAAIEEFRQRLGLTRN